MLRRIKLIRILKVLVLFTSIIFVWSCKKKSEVSIPKLPTSFVHTDFTMDDLFSDIQFIPLSSKVPFTNPVGTVLSDSLLYIPTYEGKVLVFNMSGQLLHSYFKRGRGPDEYGNIADFNIIGDNIFLNSTVSKRIKIYDLKFNFQRDILYPQGFTYGDLSYLDSTLFLFSCSSFKLPKYDWIAMDIKGRQIRSKEYLASKIPPASEVEASCVQIVMDSCIFLFREESDTVFKIKQWNDAPGFIIDNDFEDGTKGISQFELGSLPNPKGRKRVEKIISAGNYWIIMYRTESNPSFSETVLFNPEQNASKLISKITFDQIHRPLSFGLPFDWVGTGYLIPSFFVKSNMDKYIACILDSNIFLEFTKSDRFKSSIPKYPEVKSKMIDVSNNLTLEDNPILILLKLK